MVKFVWNTGQSNSGPWHDDETWMDDRIDLNLVVSSRRVAGSTNTMFTVPGNFPGFTNAKDLKGLCIRTLRYFVLYNPCGSGYETYPGMCRVAAVSSMPNGLANTASDVIVDKRFKAGANGIASVYRRMTGTTHTVTVTELTDQFATTDVDTGTNKITVTGHSWTANQSVRVMSTDTLPGGLDGTTVYYIRNPGPNDFELSATAGPGAAVNITDVGSGTHTIMHAYAANAAEPATVGASLAVSPDFDPPPASGEELCYTHTANAGGSTTTTVLSQHYGLLKAGALTGCVLRCITATNAGNVNQEVVISAWDDATRTATHAGFPAATTAGDTFIIKPGNATTALGVTTPTLAQLPALWGAWGLWLPWCPFERDLNANALFGEISKTNPYPPGFDYPSHWHLPQVYGASNQEVETVGSLNLTISHRVAWHIGGMVRLAEQLGEEVWCLSSDFGGSSTAHREFELGTRALAWYDPAQMTDWAMSRPNGCFERSLAELDAAAAQAIQQTESLELVAVFRTQGDGDATSGTHGYASPFGAPTAWLSKFLDSNRAFRARVRAELTERELWSEDASKIPWIQPLVSTDTSDQTEDVEGSLSTVDLINIGLGQLAAEDPYAATFDPTGLEMMSDGIHYLGSELDEIERMAIDAYNSILHQTDQTGVVDLVNVALGHLGEAGVVESIDPPDESFAAEQAAVLYPRARRAVLEMHNWPFAMARTSPPQMKDTETGTWRYAYVAPGDMLRAVSVLPPGAGDDYMQLGANTAAAQTFAGFVSGSNAASGVYEPPSTVIATQNQQTTQHYNIERRTDGTRIIYTNVAQAQLRYVIDVQDTRAYPELFSQALTWKLASMLAGPIVKGDKGREAERSCLQMMQWYLSQAKAASGAQRNIKPDQGMPFSRG